MIQGAIVQVCGESSTSFCVGYLYLDLIVFALRAFSSVELSCLLNSKHHSAVIFSVVDIHALCSFPAQRALAC